MTDILLRTFNIKSIRHSGLLLDAIVYFLSLGPVVAAIGRKVDRLIYTHYDEEDTTPYFDYLVDQHVWERDTAGIYSCKI
jgi:hypothetical protein